MRLSKTWRGGLVWRLILGWLLGGGIGLANDSRRAWELSAGYSSGEALQIWEEHDVSSEQRLGKAVALLGRFPQTPGNVDAAEVILKELRTDPEAKEFWPATIYTLARIEHIFREGREEEAAVYYRQLARDFGGHQLADAALVKLTLMNLEALPVVASRDDVREVIRALPQPAHRSARSDQHAIIVEFLLARRDLHEALEHLLIVRDLDVNRGKSRADLLVQLGRVADEVSRLELARLTYERFLKEFPMDLRGYMVRQELRKVNAKGGEG